MGKHDSGFNAAYYDNKAIQYSHFIIRFCVKVMAILMTLLIIWAVFDVVYVMYKKLITPPFMLLAISDILAIFSAFLAVLIAIEIFINIVMYLRDDAIHINLVIATALMAIARKVIVLDFTKTAPEYLWGTAALVLALGVTYWLLALKRNDMVLLSE
jgi:uncharacterized membrane protein (DUF373 family)